MIVSPCDVIFQQPCCLPFHLFQSFIVATNGNDAVKTLYLRLPESDNKVVGLFPLEDTPGESVWYLSLLSLGGEQGHVALLWNDTALSCIFKPVRKIYSDRLNVTRESSQLRVELRGPWCFLSSVVSL